MSDAAPSARRGVPAVWSYLTVGTLLLCALNAGPAPVRSAAAVLIIGGGLTALATGTRRHARPGHRGPWRGLLASQVLFVMAMLVRIVLPFAGNVPPEQVRLLLDAFIVPACLTMGWSFSRMLRRRRANEDDPAGLDAILVGLTAAFMAWTFLIAPTLAGRHLDLLGLANAFFPIIDVVLLTLVALLVLAHGVRKLSLWLLVAAAGSMFTGDTLFTLADLGLARVPLPVMNTMFLTTFLLLGAAALDPSMASLTEPQPVQITELGRIRLAVIATLVVVPTTISTLVPAGSLLGGLIRAALCGLLVVAVLSRLVRSEASRAVAERINRRRSTHDGLTGLPNRELLTETIGRWADAAADEHQEISLLFIDLDRFKLVNDHWGHKVGDELLCAVASRLAAVIRDVDLVCRIGGDEFVIALASPSHTRLAEPLADRVLAELARPFVLSAGQVVVSASIGVAKSLGGAEAIELIRDADTAMYKAKGSGRNGYAVFDLSLRDEVRDRMTLEQALRPALANGELSVHYQPIVDLATGQVSGFEALMRWTSPKLGFVSPVDFIGIAEETGLIVESGAWLLRESVAQLARWTAQRPSDAPELHVSVNVSVRQLRDDSIVSTVRDALAASGLPPSALWLEITESGVMEDLEVALAALGALRELGVTLCIDDFGTGYSSLSYLNRLPVGIVKVDRSFVAEVGRDGVNEPIVRAVLAMTRAMGMRVVAEGIETEEQWDWLRAHGCEMGQGWFFGKAKPAQQQMAFKAADPVRIGPGTPVGASREG